MVEKFWERRHNCIQIPKRDHAHSSCNAPKQVPSPVHAFPMVQRGLESDHSVDNDCRIQGREPVGERDYQSVPPTVVLWVVVGRECYESTKSQAEAEEDLGRSIQPYSRFSEFGKLKTLGISSPSGEAYQKLTSGVNMYSSPSMAPSNIIARTKNTVKTMYGKMAVKHITCRRTKMWLETQANEAKDSLFQTI